MGPFRPPASSCGCAPHCDDGCVYMAHYHSNSQASREERIEAIASPNRSQPLCKPHPTTTPPLISSPVFRADASEATRNPASQRPHLGSHGGAQHCVPYREGGRRLLSWGPCSRCKEGHMVLSRPWAFFNVERLLSMRKMRPAQGNRSVVPRVPAAARWVLTGPCLSVSASG